MDATHRKLAAQCFNAAWDLIEKPDRTVEETDEMIDLAHASRWHWTHTRECTPLNLAVGAWQLSRVYAIADCPTEAAHHAEVSLALCHRHDLPTFYEGYAYAALARSAPPEKRGEYLITARALASQVTDERDRAALLADLDDIETADG
jgi:hypothetical protein